LVVGVFRQTRSHPEEARFAEIFRAFPVGVALLTDEGFFLEVNDALCGLLGYPREDLVGTPFARLVHPDEVDAAQDVRLRVDGRDVAVLFVDLDHVKQVNDALGHEAGDELLVTAAKNLQSVVRETDTVARLGGDEFVVVVERAAGLPELETLAERMLEAVRIP